MKKIDLKQKIILMGIICLIFSFFVWNWTEMRINLYLSRINSGLERVAQVQTKSNSVIRNHNGQLLWQDIGSGEIIYLGNSIQTEKDSSTEIIFDDGEKILIGPESLVRFNRADDKISLQLVEGKIEVQSPDIALQESMRLKYDKPKRLFIKTPRGRLNIKNANLKIKADKNDQNNFKVEVVKGEPELITPTEKEILPITTSEVEKINVVKIEEVKQELVSPIEKTVPAIIEPQTIEEPSFELVENNIESEIKRKPAAQILLTAPKVKSIRVKEAK